MPQAITDPNWGLPTAPTASDPTDPNWGTPTFSATNQKDASGGAVVEPNTIGTFTRHVGKQIDPIALVKMVGSVLTTDPRTTLKGIGAAQGAMYDKAKASYQAGDYSTAARHFINYLIPMLGPGLDQSSDLLNEGQWAAGAGDAVGIGLSVLGPQKLQGMAAARNPLASHPAALRSVAPMNPLTQFAREHDIPLDAATVSDNLAVKGTQALADRSLGGSLVATPARAKQADAMTATGGRLAARSHPAPVTPEQAGIGLSDSLGKKIEGHTRTANTAYNTIRELEQQPGELFHGSPQTLSSLNPGSMFSNDPVWAAGYTTRFNTHGVESFGGPGRIHALGVPPGPTLTARTVHGAESLLLERAHAILGRGAATLKEAAEVVHRDTGVVAIIAKNAQGKTTGGISLVPSGVAGYADPVKAIQTAASAGRHVPENLLAASKGLKAGDDMGFPTNVKPVKEALRPIYDQMLRQMPIMQQQANPGLKAIQNILDGPDYAPLSQVDRDLSAIKSIARQHGGLGKLAVSKLEAAVQDAAAAGGPDVLKALRTGRAATIAKYTTDDVLQGLKAEPVRTVSMLTAPKDSAIVQLRGVLQQVPGQAPVLARAYLEDLLAKPNKVAEWYKLGPETKRALFPDAGHAKALDQFFTLTDRISKTNVNPSGSGYMASLGAQGAMLWYDTISAGGVQIVGAALSKLLRSPAAVRVLTEGLKMPVSAPPVARAAVTAKLVEVAREAGVPLALPKAADREPSPGGRN